MSYRALLHVVLALRTHKLLSAFLRFNWHRTNPMMIQHLRALPKLEERVEPEENFGQAKARDEQARPFRDQVS